MVVTLHAVVAGWLLGPPSGANRRLLALLTHTGTQLHPGERITVLHRRDFTPPPRRGIAWLPIDIPAGPSWTRARAEQRLLPDCLRELAATVYDHGFLPLPRVPVPTCLLVHDLRAVDGFSRWPRWLARAVLRRSCERADAIVAPSHWTAGRLRLLVPAAPIAVVVKNGVESVATGGAPLQMPLPANGYLLHVGHIEPRKGLRLVVQAVAQLPTAQRPELWLAGRDAGALRSLQQTANALQVRLHVLGVVDELTLAGLYRQARAVVMPSLHEGFGLPALEGLAHRRPVLVCNTTALPEVVGTLGVTLPPHDPERWALAIAATTTHVVDEAACRQHLATMQWPDAAAELLATWRRLSR